MINLRKFQKDDAHELHNVRKMYLKWHKDDRAYCRELYCYDLFRRFGVWTAAYSSYCRLWIHVEGDSKPAYYGVYEMIEARKVANRVENQRQRAIMYHDTVEIFFDEIRTHIDRLEEVIDDQLWPLPKYRELLFIK